MQCMQQSECMFGPGTGAHVAQDHHPQFVQLLVIVCISELLVISTTVTLSIQLCIKHCPSSQGDALWLPFPLVSHPQGGRRVLAGVLPSPPHTAAASFVLILGPTDPACPCTHEILPVVPQALRILG